MMGGGGEEIRKTAYQQCERRKSESEARKAEKEERSVRIPSLPVADDLNVVAVVDVEDVEKAYLSVVVEVYHPR